MWTNWQDSSKKARMLGLGDPFRLLQQPHLEQKRPLAPSSHQGASSVRRRSVRLPARRGEILDPDHRDWAISTINCCPHRRLAQALQICSHSVRSGSLVMSCSIDRSSAPRFSYKVCLPLFLSRSRHWLALVIG